MCNPTFLNEIRHEHSNRHQRALGFDMVAFRLG
jgi:hypothetical protein